MNKKIVGKTMKTSKTIIIVSLVLFVSAISVTAQDIHEAAKAGNLELLKKMLGKNPTLVNNPDKNKMASSFHTIDARKLRAALLRISHGAVVFMIKPRSKMDQKSGEVH